MTFNNSCSIKSKFLSGSLTLKAGPKRNQGKLMRDVERYSANTKHLQIWHVTCYCYSKQHPCGEMWRSLARRRAYVEEKIQPFGLKIPGENKLLALCMTCCPVIKLVGLQKGPFRDSDRYCLSVMCTRLGANTVSSINRWLILLVNLVKRKS